MPVSSLPTRLYSRQTPLDPDRDMAFHFLCSGLLFISLCSHDFSLNYLSVSGCAFPAYCLGGRSRHRAVFPGLTYRRCADTGINLDTATSL